MSNQTFGYMRRRERCVSPSAWEADYCFCVSICRNLEDNHLDQRVFQELAITKRLAILYDVHSCILKPIKSCEHA